MHLRMLFASALSLPLELTYAALSSSTSCESPTGAGPVHTVNSYTTSTVTKTLTGTTVTGTINGGVPDHYVTIHKRVFSTQEHDEYLDSYVSTIWDRYTEIFPRPVITVTISPDSSASEPTTPASRPGTPRVRKSRRLRRDAESEGDEWAQDNVEQSPQGEDDTAEEDDTQTIVCDTTFFTTSTERTISTTHISGGPPSRTFTITVTHTEFVDHFLTPPGTVATVHEPTFYHSHTTSYAVVTATTSTAASGETYVNVWGIDESTEGWKG